MGTPTLNLVTIEGVQVHLNMEDVDYVEVLDDGLTNDDYTDAQDILIVTKDGNEYQIDIFDNLDSKDLIWDLFDTM